MTAAGQPKHLVILQTADVHAQLLTHSELFLVNGQLVFRQAGGYARVKTVLDQVRREWPNRCCVVDCGDSFHGSALATWSRGEALVPILNALKYDLILPGNWDVQHGSEQFGRLFGALNASPVLANVFRKGEATPVFALSHVIELDGVRVGFVGVTDPKTPQRQPPAYTTDLWFKEPADVLAREVRRLRETEHCRVVILLSHLGLAQEVALAGRPEAAGVDVILGADTHERIRQPIVVNGKLVVEPGAFGSFVGRLDLWVADGIVESSYQLIETSADQIPEDPAMLELIDSISSAYAAQLQPVIGQTATPLYRNSVLETPMDNLITDAMRAATGTDIALSNGFRFAPPIMPGKITEADLWNMLPTADKIKTGRVTGRQLQHWMNLELEHVLSRDPSRRVGGWLVRFSGMQIRFEALQGDGPRLERLLIHGRPLDPQAEYTICACAREGEPLDELCRLQGVKEAAVTDVTVHDAVRHYLHAHSPIAYGMEGRAIGSDLPQVVYAYYPGLPYSFM